jgi:hypothetical protein
MPENLPSKPDKLALFQKNAFWFSVSFFIVYKFFLKDEDIKQALGVGYPWFLMTVTVVFLTCAGLSGKFLLDFFEKIKAFTSKKENE